MPAPAASYAPATDRNREPILDVLRRVFSEPGTVLEVAAGTGQHAAYFAKALPHLRWQPTDRTDEGFASIMAWSEDAGCPNLLAPRVLDASREPWSVNQADYIFCANMIHIAPREAMEGLIAGAGRTLRSEGKLVLYGPFKMGGAHTAPSNEAFDESLRGRDPRWGVRDLEEVVALAEQAGLSLDERIAMPANNFVLVLGNG